MIWIKVYKLLKNLPLSLDGVSLCFPPNIVLSWVSGGAGGGVGGAVGGPGDVVGGDEAIIKNSN